MQEQHSDSVLERFILWCVVAILIAGWWGVIGALLHNKANGPLVCFATLNIVLTLRWLAARMEKRSHAFCYIVALVARITAVWFPLALGSIIPMVPIGLLATACFYPQWTINTAFEPAGEESVAIAIAGWRIYALTIGVGTGLVALLTLYLKRRELILPPETL